MIRVRVGVKIKDQPLIRLFNDEGILAISVDTVAWQKRETFQSKAPEAT